MISESQQKDLIRPLVILISMAGGACFLRFFPGIDGDFYDTLTAMHNIGERLQYAPVRNPGQPIYDYMGAWIIRLAGEGAVPYYSLLMAAVASVCLFEIACMAAPPLASLAVVLIFQLCPSFFPYAVAVSDYMPSFGFFLAGLLCLLKERRTASLVLLLIAIGHRLPFAVYALLFAIYIWGQTRDIRQALRYFGLCGLGSFLIYSPILLNKGMGALSNMDWWFGLSLRHMALAFGYHVVEHGFGPLILASLLVCCLVFIRRIAQAAWRNGATALMLAIVVLNALLFFRYPTKGSILFAATALLPVVLAAAVPRAFLWTVVAAACVQGLLVSAQFYDRETDGFRPKVSRGQLIGLYGECVRNWYYLDVLHEVLSTLREDPPCVVVMPSTVTCFPYWKGNTKPLDRPLDDNIFYFSDLGPQKAFVSETWAKTPEGRQRLCSGYRKVYYDRWAYGNLMRWGSKAGSERNWILREGTPLIVWDKP